MGIVLTGLTAVSLAGCVSSPPPYLAAPADPSARVPQLRYEAVAGQTKTFRPAEPKNWEELNRRVGPKS